MEELVAIPKGWVESFGEIIKFTSRITGEVLRLRVFRFFGEALRQSGILIVSSTLVIWGLIFITGLECGIEGAQQVGALDHGPGVRDRGRLPAARPGRSPLRRRLRRVV